MATGIALPAGQKHVPAWRRIGLKLKNESGSSVQHNAQIHRDRSHGPEQASDVTVSPAKKRKIHAESTSNFERSTESSEPSRRNIEEPTADRVDRRDSHGTGAARAQVETSVVEAQSRSAQHNHSIDATEKLQPPPRRKSVTFTPDTKSDTETVAAEPLLQPLAADSSSDSLLASADPAISPKKAKQRRERDKPDAKTIDARSQNLNDRPEHARGRPEFVAYLVTFHTNKTSWKFNKNKQNDLLKNLFNVHRISEDLNEALLSYIAGLQGPAARRRIIEEATALLKEIAEKNTNFEEPSNMESGQARRDAYKAALQRHVHLYERAKVTRDEYDDHQVEQLRQDVIIGQRADEVLEILLRKELYPEPQTKPLEKPAVRPATVNGHASESRSTSKRKRRTQASSESSSDDSDDTSADEGPTTAKRGPTTVHEALKVQPGLAYRPNTAVPTGKKKVFDDDLLDQLFPKPKTYDESTPKKTTGNAPNGKMNGTGPARARSTTSDTSESDTSSDGESDSDSSSESESEGT